MEMDKNTILRIDKTEDNKGFDLGIKSYEKVGEALTEWAGQMHRKGDDNPLRMLVSSVATIATIEEIMDPIIVVMLQIKEKIKGIDEKK